MESFSKGEADAGGATSRSRPRCWSSGATIGFGLTAIGLFQVAFSVARFAWLIVGYAFCLFQLRRVATPRRAFYLGLLVGLGVFVPQMLFLWEIFRWAAIPLWLILAFFHGLFLAMLQQVEFRLSATWAAVLAPVLWCGIEYFRSEVWWLRFSWLTAGSVLATGPTVLLAAWGAYGVGFLVFAVAVLMSQIARRRSAWLATVAFFVGVIGIAFCRYSLRSEIGSEVRTVKVAGAQLEFPGVPEVITTLDRLAKSQPDAELLMLSEYTFDGPVPERVGLWCQKHAKWLVVGGKESVAEFLARRDPAGSTKASAGEDSHRTDSYFNTVFVVSTNGQVIFSQAKSQPIQFFKDGEPAREQRVWESPWGKLGFAICYDASYRRVTDGLIRQGAEALLVPTMDLEPWGQWQHELNARMSRLRAREYRVPIFRVASSGISLLLDARGSELAAAPFPGLGAFLSGDLQLGKLGGSVPFDAWLAPACSVITGVVLVSLWGAKWIGKCVSFRGKGAPKTSSA